LASLFQEPHPGTSGKLGLLERGVGLPPSGSLPEYAKPRCLHSDPLSNITDLLLDPRLSSHPVFLCFPQALPCVDSSQDSAHLHVLYLGPRHLCFSGTGIPPGPCFPQGALETAWFCCRQPKPYKVSPCLQMPQSAACGLPDCCGLASQLPSLCPSLPLL
jgi:hypothetical protein